MPLADRRTPAGKRIDLFGALHGNQADGYAYFGVFSQTVPVEEFCSPENVARIKSQSLSVEDHVNPRRGTPSPTPGAP